jgi:hypothetical protein
MPSVLQFGSRITRGMRPCWYSNPYIVPFAMKQSIHQFMTYDKSFTITETFLANNNEKINIILASSSFLLAEKI